MIHDNVKNDEFKFLKFSKIQNYKKWNKNIINALQIAKIWNLIFDIENSFRKREKKLFTINKRSKMLKRTFTI